MKCPQEKKKRHKEKKKNKSNIWLLHINGIWWSWSQHAAEKWTDLHPKNYRSQKSVSGGVWWQMQDDGWDDGAPWRWWCDDGNTLHMRAANTPGCASAVQQSWKWRTYVSVLPFLLAPFGLLQGCFHLHPVMYNVKVREEMHKERKKEAAVRRVRGVSNKKMLCKG